MLSDPEEKVLLEIERHLLRDSQLARRFDRPPHLLRAGAARGPKAELTTIAAGLALRTAILLGPRWLTDTERFALCAAVPPWIAEQAQAGTTADMGAASEHDHAGPADPPGQYRSLVTAVAELEDLGYATAG